jgi:hypothetical protein
MNIFYILTGQIFFIFWQVDQYFFTFCQDKYFSYFDMGMNIFSKLFLYFLTRGNIFYIWLSIGTKKFEIGLNIG